MTKEPTSRINAFSARNLTLKQLENWSLAGASHRDELKRIVKEITLSLHRSTSPAKSLNGAIKKLELLFSKREVRGDVNLINNRHINFKMAFPDTSNDGLIFYLLYGEINARTGAVKFELTSPIQMSLHALQRLFERLDDKSDVSVLNEIYSCISLVIHWHKGATEIEAKCWPLMSKNGFFIGVAERGSKTTSFVTWIKNERIGKKWGLPLNNLISLKEIQPQRLEDHIFAREFIRSFPWMLHEYVPGEDFISLAWEHREDEVSELDIVAIDLEENLTNEKSDAPNHQLKLSTSYVAGLNYKDGPPNFKTHSLHSGIVVQKRGDGHVIVGLKNGWVGKIPRISIDRGIDLIPGYVTPKIGDDITVFVHKITHFPLEGAYALSLDPKEITEANWRKIESVHPIGSLFNATLISKQYLEFMAQLDSGIRGVIPSSEVHIFLNKINKNENNSIGLILNVVITGYREEKKCLLLSIENIESKLPIETIPNRFKIGDHVFGKCVKNASNYVLIEVQQGILGLFHKFNNWGEPLPEIGQEVELVIIDINESQLFLAAPLKANRERTFYAHPLSNEKWDYFIDNYSEFDSIEVQILFWREKNQCYMVVTDNGVVGVMPASEVDWHYLPRDEQKLLLKPGDIFNAMILKIHQGKNKVIFSKKAIEKHPIGDELLKINHKNEISGLIVNVTDFGYFVSLEQYGIQALLHKSNIPEGITYNIGERLSVFIDVIDRERRRVSIKLTDT